MKDKGDEVALYISALAGCEEIRNDIEDKRSIDQKHVRKDCKRSYSSSEKSLLNRYRFIVEYGVTTQIEVEDNGEMSQLLY